MSIFGKIMSSIFGRASAEGAAPTAPTPGAPPSSASPSIAPAAPASGAPAPSGKSAGSATASAPAGSAAQVDVAAILTKLAAEKKEKLDWRHSIVDLMKLLDLDSSVSARKELAKELQYSGNLNDSASMNVWLHKQVMQKLAANGGKVPEDLRA